jgi:magnesium-transporting ATPase (P-type)
MGVAAEHGEDLFFEVLHMLPYTQERKRMSVVVRHPSGEVALYCKGADNVIYERLRNTASKGDKAVRRNTSAYMGHWGSDGLRTLCFGFKPLSEKQLGQWAHRYALACNDFDENLNRKNKLPNAIDELMDEMEQGLTLQGATANEDKLQPAVPETIALLSQAGMRVWMLTGDKQETAVNIGYATQLLNDGLDTIMATVGSAGSAVAGAALVRAKAAALRQSGLLPPLPMEEVQRRAAAARRAGAAQGGMSVAVECSAVHHFLRPQADMAPGVAAVEETGNRGTGLIEGSVVGCPVGSSPARSPAVKSASAGGDVCGEDGGSASEEPNPLYVRSVSAGCAFGDEAQSKAAPVRSRRPRLNSRSVAFESDARVIGQMSLQSLQQFGEHIGIQDSTTTGPSRRKRRSAVGRALAIVIDDAVLDELLRPEEVELGEGDTAGQGGGGADGFTGGANRKSAHSCSHCGARI